MPPRTGRNITEVVVALVIALLLLAAVSLPGLKLRSELREQVLLREGRALQAAVGMQFAVETAEMESLGLGARDVDDFATILKTSRLPGVVGVRLFDAREGTVDVFPPQLKESTLDAADWRQLATFAPVVRMHVRFPLEDLTWSPEGGSTADLAEIIVPLPSDLEGKKAAQFWIAGTGISAELTKLDESLLALSLVVWLAATAVALLVLAVASRKLRGANAELRQRRDELVRANQELALAAKVSAVGVVAAHLIHGLKNPLQGLRGLTMDQSRNSNTSGEDRSAWLDAASMTNRLQSMVDDVTALLTDEASGIQFRVTCGELREIVMQRTGDVRRTSGVELTWRGENSVEFDNRLAALVSLIISNLVTNACEASRPGTAVHVGILLKRDFVEIAVSDRGEGIPVERRERLFLPSTSSKPHGSGIGLAVSRNLAQHVSASLELEETGPAGTVFVLKVPVSAGVKLA